MSDFGTKRDHGFCTKPGFSAPAPCQRDPVQRHDHDPSFDAGTYGRRSFFFGHSCDALSGWHLEGQSREPRWPQRDRFIMSKGHCSGAFYSTLAFKGFFPRAMLRTFMDPLSMLNGHPDRNKLPGVEANTGPLGHGLADRGRAARWRRGCAEKSGGRLCSPATASCRRAPTGKRR